MKNERRYNRLGERYGARVFWTVLAIIFLVLISVGLIWVFNAHGRRLTVVVAVEPTSIATFDFTSHKLIILSFPSSAQISGVHGVGQYSLASLWRLGLLAPGDPSLLADSLKQIAALPVEKYLGTKNRPNYTDGVDSLHLIFSVNNLANFMDGRYITNLSFGDFLTLSWQMWSLRPEEITTLTANNQSALYLEKQPDGSIVSVVDPNKLDALIGENFADDNLRKESLRVAVYNTTQTPDLGSRVETLLKHAGILVVLVGNASPATGRCSVEGAKEVLTSLTAKFIAAAYDCLLVEADNGGRADLVVRVGRDFEKLFLPED